MDLNAVVTQLTGVLEAAGFPAYGAKDSFSPNTCEIGFPQEVTFETTKYLATALIPLVVTVPAASVADAQRQLFTMCSVNTGTSSVIDVLRAQANAGGAWRALRIVRVDRFVPAPNGGMCAQITCEVVA